MADWKVCGGGTWLNVPGTPGGWLGCTLRLDGPAAAFAMLFDGGGVALSDCGSDPSSIAARLRFLRPCCSAAAFRPRLVKGRFAIPISCECSEMSDGG